jgi:hypothetical protein
MKILKPMRHITTFAIIALVFIGKPILFGSPEDEVIKTAQQWVFALGESVKSQAKSGASDQKAIRQKAIKDTQPQEKKLREAMRAAGSTSKEVDDGIRKDRDFYLADFIKEYVKK